jgi:hypothetical protein
MIISLKEINMKKLVIASALAVAAFAASAADFVSVDVERVTNVTTKQESTAQYIRVGKTISGLQANLQSRTSRSQDGSGMFNSLEATAGKAMGKFTPFVGVGYDNGLNGGAGAAYTYGLVGATAGTKVGPGFALAGFKTRVNWDDANPKQSILFATYSVPVAKNVSVNLNASRSYLDIKERAMGLGLSIGF